MSKGVFYFGNVLYLNELTIIASKINNVLKTLYYWSMLLQIVLNKYATISIQGYTLQKLNRGGKPTNYHMHISLFLSISHSYRHAPELVNFRCCIELYS
mgnify:CR=1 FL=1